MHNCTHLWTFFRLFWDCCWNESTAEKNEDEKLEEAFFHPFSWIESMEKLLLKLILLLSKKKIRQNILGPNAGQASWAGLYGLLSVLNWQKWWPPLGLEPPNVLYSTLRWIEKDNCLVSGFSQIPATSPSALCTLHSSSFSSSQKCVQGEEPLQCLLCKKVGLNISHSSPKITHPWRKKKLRKTAVHIFFRG